MNQHNLPALPHLQAVRMTHSESDNRTRGCETHSRTSRISSGKIVYDPATEPDGAHRRWLREAPDHRCCLRGRVYCVRHGQPPTPPQQGARDDWRRTPDRHDTHHAGKQTLFRGAEQEEETMATITKRNTQGSVLATMLFNLHTNDQYAWDAWSGASSKITKHIIGGLTVDLMPILTNSNRQNVLYTYLSHTTTR